VNLADTLEEAAGLRGKVRSQIKRAFTKSRRPRPMSQVRRSKKKRAFKLPKPPKPFVRAPVEIGEPEA
jgi:hypothetical protein